jgi:hypothetical protein
LERKERGKKISVTEREDKANKTHEEKELNTYEKEYKVKL